MTNNLIIKNLRIYYQNVRGLRTKTDAFYRLICLNAYDIVVLTETWLVDGISDSELFNDQYIVWRRDRDYTLTGQTRGGGVLIAINKHISAVPQPLFHSTAEDLWVSISLRDPITRNCFKLNLGVVYLCRQNQGHSFSNQLLNFINNLSTLVLNNVNNDKFLIVGDFNLSGISWQLVNNSLLPSNSNSSDECILVDELRVMGLSQLNNIVNFYGKILDLVLCNDDGVCVSECPAPLAPVDKYHPVLLIDINFASYDYLTPAPYSRYLYDKGDFSSINNEISAIDWVNIFANRSLDECVDYFYSTMADLRNKYIPSKSIRPNSYPIWYSSSLIRLIKEKSKYHRKYKLYGRLSDEITFKMLRDRVKKMEACCYTNYLSSTEASIEKNPKHFWSFVKRRSKSNSMPSYLKYEDKTISSVDDICNAFSSHFYSTFLDPIDDAGPDSRPSVPQPMMNVNAVGDISSIEIDVERITKLLANLDPFKSAGPDNLSPKFIIRTAKSIALPISLLFKKSISTSTVPQIWKSAYITPVHKKGSKNEIINYRPISKLCIVAKVFERVVYDQVYTALKCTFSPSQHGFLKGRSTVSNLTLLNDYVTAGMDGGAQVDVVYTDYSKAFDRIDHSILKMKLCSNGIRGDLLRWFSSYLENRSQSVVIANYTSSWILIPSGVPQGSLMAPLLFIIYVNDIDSCFRHSNLLCFADDMKIYSSISSIKDVEALQSDLSRLDVYCQTNKLDLNPSKCSIVTFSRKRSPILANYELKGQILPRCDGVRDLGVYHDSKLLFDTHIEQVVAKASKALGFVMRISKCFKKGKTFKILYCAFVRSHLEYASQIWNPRYDKYIDRLEGVQKRFIRILCYRLNIPYRSENYINLCKKFHLQPLVNRRRLADCSFLLKLLSNEIDCPNLLQNLSFCIPQKSVRFNPPISIPFSSSNYRQNTYMLRASKDFNKLCKEYSFDPFNTKSVVVRRQLNLDFFKI